MLPHVCRPPAELGCTAKEGKFGASVGTLGRLVNRNLASRPRLGRKHLRGGLPFLKFREAGRAFRQHTDYRTGARAMGAPPAVLAFAELWIYHGGLGVEHLSRWLQS